MTTIVAARKRGWTVHMIAAAANVSKQAIQQRLKTCADSSLLEKRFSKKDQSRGKTALTCATCGKVIWQGHRDKEKFCSRRCSSTYRRKRSEKEVLQTIEFRRGGHSWTSIEHKLGYSMQTLQRRIWHHLHRKGLLTRSVVWGIWAPGARWRDRSPSWKWLERRTGILLRSARNNRKR